MPGLAKRSHEAQLLLASPCELGESPTWLEKTGELVWIDAAISVLYSLKPGAAKARADTIPGQAPTGMVIPTDRDDVFLVSQCDGLVLFDRQIGTTTPFAHPTASMPHLCYNDGKVDGKGRLWVGTADRQETDPRGIFYRFDGNLAVPVDAGFAVCNGPAFSRDGSRLYLSDSVGQQILVYDIDDGGRLQNRRVLARFGQGDGVPDGMTVDGEDCLWVAHFGGGRVSCLSPDGRLVASIELPVPNVTSLCFGGSALKTLFITTAREGLDAAEREAVPLSGSVFFAEVDVAGPAAPVFTWTP